MKKKLIPYYEAAQKSSVVENLCKVADDQFTFKHKTEFGGIGCFVNVYVDVRSKCVTIGISDPHNGDIDYDDISLEGFLKYITPEIKTNKSELSIDFGIAIQTDQLASLKTVLKKKVFKALVEHATKDNDKAKTGFDIFRGDDLVHFVKRVANGNIKID